MNINDCLSQIIALTQQNVEILRAINDSFYTNKSHISLEVNGAKLSIPSFLSLENKIDILQQNLENVLDAPRTGEAYTYFDGTTQKLELSGYATTPSHVDLQAIQNFYSKSNNIFKDFMSPNPYVRLDIMSIPNNIKHVNVQKVALINPDLISLTKQLTNLDDSDYSVSVSYPDIYRLLYNYTECVDYTLYNTIMRLPLREGGAFGSYNIETIVDNYQDADFNEHYTLILDNDLTYTVANGTIQRDIIVGDLLITNNDKVQMVVEEVYPTSRTVKVQIRFGGYANLCDKTSNNPDLYNLKFYKPVSWNDNKYIEVPIEEDSHICIFVAPINDTTNTQAPWGTGLYINTDNLTDNQGRNFNEYYREYVNNIGDTLFAITHMMTDDSQIEKLHHNEFDDLRNHQPTIMNANGDNITVTQINKHLNDSSSIQAIRRLYSQKVEYRNQLNSVQDSIDNLNNMISSIAFDDTTNTRMLYEEQLAEFNAKKRELTASILSIVEDISENANNSEVPIENAKYHIRGFIDVSEFERDNHLVRVIGIDVEYRYKNKNRFVGNAETISDEFIYSDWNKMSGVRRKLIPNYINNSYVYELEPLNEDQNAISFNQIDIPISQGETVDIRVRFVYNLGHPFVEFTSAWSEIYNVAFPEEFLANVEILDILGENNDDIKKNQYLGMMEQYGLIDHASDLIQDQTIKYYHQPEHISSGFYTAERRIIPLKDKLYDIVRSLSSLQTEVYGAIGDNLEITISDDASVSQLRPNVVNTFRTVSYDRNNTRLDIDDSIVGLIHDADFAYSQLILSIKNNGEFPIKLHSLFPGDYHAELNPNNAVSKYDVNDYIILDNNNSNVGGVYMQFDEDMTNNDEFVINQRLNQFIYFRTKVQGAQPLYSFNAYDILKQDAIQEDLKLSANPMLCTDQIALEHRTTTMNASNANEDTVRYNAATPNQISRMRFRDHEVSGNILVPLQGVTPIPEIQRSAFLLPYPGALNHICITSSDSFITIEPGSSILLPLSFYYWFDSTSPNNLQSGQSVTRSISFDIRTSLFAEPINYKLNVSAYKSDTSNFRTRTVLDAQGLSAYNITSTTDNNTTRPNRVPYRRRR